MLDRVELQKVGLKYGKDPVIKSVSTVLELNTLTGIAGPNGSGKSTLMQIISGNLSPSRGTVKFLNSGTPLPDEDIYKHMSYAAPYVDIPGELKLLELLQFTGRLKPWRNQYTAEEILLLSGLEQAAEKKLKDFSSGMKQRAKLTLALLQHTSLVLLDEPTSNLDDTAKKWFIELLDKHRAQRIVLIASNEREDLALCDRILQLPS